MGRLGASNRRILSLAERRLLETLEAAFVSGAGEGMMIDDNIYLESGGFLTTHDPNSYGLK